jgi:hypothetical protein
MKQGTYRVLFDWNRFEAALREAAGRRGWDADQTEAALQRDRICTIDVGDIEAHLDWHERLGFDAPKHRASEG